MAAAASNVLLPGEMVGPLKLADDIVDCGPEIAEGALRLTLAPGLGAKPAPAKLGIYGAASAGGQA